MEIKEDTGIWVQDSTGAKIHFSRREEAVAVSFVLYVYSCKNTYDRDWLFQIASKRCKEGFCNDVREFSHVLDWISSISPQEIPSVLKHWKMDYRELLAIKICTEEIIADPVHYVLNMEEVISKGDFVDNSLSGLGLANRNHRIYVTPAAMSLREDANNFVKICINTLKSLIEGN